MSLKRGDKKMKIKDNRSGASTFEELSVGDIFIFDDEIFMKITSSGPNSVYLKNGTTAYFLKDTVVKLIDDVTLVLN